MNAMTSQITSLLTFVYSSVYSTRRSKKYQSSTSLVFVRGIHREPVNSPHKGPVTRKTFSFDYVITDLGAKHYFQSLFPHHKSFTYALKNTNLERYTDFGRELCKYIAIELIALVHMVLTKTGHPDNPCRPYVSRVDYTDYRTSPTIGPLDTWICNYIHYRMLYQITYPFPIFNDCSVECLGMDT